MFSNFSQFILPWQPTIWLLTFRSNNYRCIIVALTAAVLCVMILTSVKYQHNPVVSISVYNLRSLKKNNLTFFHYNTHTHTHTNVCVCVYIYIYIYIYTNKYFQIRPVLLDLGNKTQKIRSSHCQNNDSLQVYYSLRLKKNIYISLGSPFTHHLQWCIHVWWWWCWWWCWSWWCCW